MVAAFGSHNREEYFNAFDPTATFVFHNMDRILQSRAEYEQEWLSWEEDGFTVLDCQSYNGSVTMLGEDVGVFTHIVRTTLAGEEGPIETGERETIIFQNIDGVWLGVHEHLSIDPTFDEE